MAELDERRADLAGGQRIKHVSVIGIGAMRAGDFCDLSWHSMEDGTPPSYSTSERFELRAQSFERGFERGEGSGDSGQIAIAAERFELERGFDGRLRAKVGHGSLQTVGC